MMGQRGPWFILTGIALGLVLGVLFAWLISPVQFTEINPAALDSAGQDRYRAQIALAYQATGNLERARQRLELLHENGSSQALAAQAQRILAQDAQNPEARALALLTSALGPPPAATAPAQPLQAELPTRTETPPATPSQAAIQAVRTATPLPSPTLTLTPTVTQTPRLTFTTAPTKRPSATRGAPYSVKLSVKVCDPTLPPNLLQVQVLDGSGKGVAGVRINVTWTGGEDFFFTGLAADAGPGYADFVMDPQVSYSVRAAENGEAAASVKAAVCTAQNGASYQGGWQVTFTQ